MDGVTWLYSTVVKIENDSKKYELALLQAAAVLQHHTVIWLKVD